MCLTSNLKIKQGKGGDIMQWKSEYTWLAGGFVAGALVVYLWKK
jgi:hypothetical protein